MDLAALTALALARERELQNVLESIALTSQPRTPPTKKTKKWHSSAPRQNEQHGEESWQNEQQGEEEQHGEEERWQNEQHGEEERGHKLESLIKSRPPIDYSLHSWNTQDALRMQQRVVPPPPRVVPPPPAAWEAPAMEIADYEGRLRDLENRGWQNEPTLEIEASDRCDWDSYKSDSPIVSPGQLGFDSGSENEEQKVHDEEESWQQEQHGGEKETWQNEQHGDDSVAGKESWQAEQRGSKETWQHEQHGSKETWHREQFVAAHDPLRPLPQGLGYGLLVIAEESWHEKPHGSTETWQHEQEHVAKTKGYGKGKDGDKGGGKSKDGGKDGGKSKDGGKGGGKSKDGGKGGGKGKKRDFDGAFDNVSSTIESLSSAVTALLQSSSGSSSSALALGRASATAGFGPMTISGEDVQKFKMIQDSVVRAKRSTQNTHRMLQSLAAQMQEETEILSAAETFLQETFSRWRRP